MSKLAPVLALFFAACSPDWKAPVFDDPEVSANVSIGDLREYYDGAQLTVNEGITFTGRVVSSDRAGNFYNTFFIDDGTGAVEIMAGMPDLDATYHPGQQIAVRARGLAVGWRDGAMQVGLPPEPGSRFATGYFYHPAVIRQWISAERSVEKVDPIELSPSRFSTDFCGRLVRISGLRTNVPRGTKWAVAMPEPANGYVAFYTERGDSIVCVTSGYASFADAEVPRSRGSLTGILFYGKGAAGRDHFMLKIRDENDIDFPEN